MNVKSLTKASPVLLGLLGLLGTTGTSAATLGGNVMADGTWYTVAGGSMGSSFTSSFNFTLSGSGSNATGQQQSLDLGTIFGPFGFSPMNTFTWQLDGGPANTIVSNVMQSLGSISYGSHTLSFTGTGNGSGIIGFTGQVAFVPVVPEAETWMMLMAGMSLIGMRVSKKQKKLTEGVLS